MTFRGAGTAGGRAAVRVVIMWMLAAAALWLLRLALTETGPVAPDWPSRGEELAALFRQQEAIGLDARSDRSGETTDRRDGDARGEAGAAAANGEASGRSGPAGIPQADGKRVRQIDINRASAAELTELPGIGPAKAQAIVEYRERNGPFRTPDELTNVKGIGPKTLESLKPHITTGPSGG